MANTQRNDKQHIFVIVRGGVAEVDVSTVPASVEVEVIDLDDLAAEPSAAIKLSAAGRAYAKGCGYI